MPRPRSTIPTYRKHSATGRAAVSFYRADGTRTEVILPGKYGSKESKAEYERLLSQLRANDGRMPTDHRQDLSIDELVLKFMEHAKAYYVDSATKETTTEVVSFRDALRPICRLYGNTPAAQFGPLAFQALRTAMVNGSWMTDEEQVNRPKAHQVVGLARTTANRQCGRVKQLFKWAASNELIPASVFHGLQSVSGLRRGRSGARETEPVEPVDADIVDAIVRELPPVTADVVRLLLLTGARVGEICQLKTPDIDRTGPVWFATLDKHKTAHHGHTRTICFGPQSQLILNRYLRADPDVFLFSPAEQDRLIAEQKRAVRKTPVQPSQVCRKKSKPSRKPGERFDHTTINNAIRRAALRLGIERFHVHRLRHTAALNILREHGAEAARSVLGHKQINMTLHYSGIDVEKAKEVMRMIG
ncbi:MAG: site-specific integrase [Gemmataceae bacterium]|nr:site-specific integrase [Gemmataceae bacterium]